MPDNTRKSIAEEVAARIAQEQARAAPEPVEANISVDEVIECMRQSEKGDGILFARLHQNRLLCVPELDNQWLAFTGAYWEPITIHDAIKAVEEVTQLYVEARIHLQEALKKTDSDTPEYSYLKHTIKGLTSAIKRTCTRRGSSAAVQMSLSCDIPMRAGLDQFDSDPWLLACPGGVVDLRTGEHRPGRPQDYQRRHTLVAWQGVEAPCPIWRAFVQQIVGDSEAVAQYMQRLWGYATLGLSKERIFVVLAGEGSNGKSVLLKTLEKVLGKYMAPIPVETLLDYGRPQNADSPTPTIMSLRNLRVAHASENDENRRFSISRVKWFTGGDTLVGRNTYAVDTTTFNPTHTLFLSTNHKPHARGHESAFWERLRLIDFPYAFVEKPSAKLPHERQRDPNLMEKLEEELPGILAWLVEGALYYQQQGMAEPDEVLAATAEYRRSEDQMRDFVEECLEHQPGERTQANNILDLFLGWWDITVAGGARNRPSKTNVGRQLKYILRDKKNVGGKVYYFDYVIKTEALSEYGIKTEK